MSLRIRSLPITSATSAYSFQRLTRDIFTWAMYPEHNSYLWNDPRDMYESKIGYPHCFS